MVAEKTRLTEVTIGKHQKKRFLIQYKHKKVIEEFLNAIQVETESEPADEVLAPHFDETSKAASLMRGGRLQTGLTQSGLAKKLGTSQSAVADMELAKRPIGIKTAKKLGELFDLDYHSLL